MIVKGTDPGQVKQVLSTTPAAIVDIFTTWCPPCKELAKELAAIARKYKHVAIVKLNLDDITGTGDGINSWAGPLPFCKEAVDLGYVPVMVFFKDGKQVDAFLDEEETKKGIISGYVPAAVIEAILKQEGMIQ